MKVVLFLLAIFAVSLQPRPVAAGGGLVNWLLLTSVVDEFTGRFNSSEHVYFELYTRANPTIYDRLNVNDQGESLSNSHFNQSNPTRIFIHGWNSDGQSDSVIEVRDAYLLKGEFNYIAVNWGIGALTVNYGDARNRVPDVGDATARMIRYLSTYGAVDKAELVVSGHSLGAHIAGFAGKDLKEYGMPTMGAIVGLDPAQPLVSLAFPTLRLAKTDAIYLQVIKSSDLGMAASIGDSDFYPNYGRVQPGCGLDIGCNHMVSQQLFARSINTPYVARRCLNYAQIAAGFCTTAGANKFLGGEPLDTTALGVFYLST